MTQNIDVSGILNSIPKKAKRNANTIKFGMFGLSLGKVTYDRLNTYCIKHNIAKATLVRQLVIKYFSSSKLSTLNFLPILLIFLGSSG